MIDGTYLCGRYNIIIFYKYKFYKYKLIKFLTH